MHPNDAPLISDPIMQALLQMLKTNTGKASAVQEDALVAIGTLVEGLLLLFSYSLIIYFCYCLVLGINFLKYIDHVLPFIYEALNNHAEYQICAAAVGVVGDLSRSLLDKLAPYCDLIMTHLLTCLGVSK
jgi:importin subunit beta-1